MWFLCTSRFSYGLRSFERKQENPKGDNHLIFLFLLSVASSSSSRWDRQTVRKHRLACCPLWPRATRGKKRGRAMFGSSTRRGYDIGLVELTDSQIYFASRQTPFPWFTTSLGRSFAICCETGCWFQAKRTVKLCNIWKC